MAAFDDNHAEKTKSQVRIALDAIRRAGEGFESSHWGYCTEQLGKAIDLLKLARFHVDVLNLLQLKEELELELITQRGHE